MQIVYGKPLEREDIIKINEISSQCGILFDTARLLFYKNIDTPEKVNRFLRHDVKNLHSPFLFRDMKNVVERIEEAKKFSQRVLIFGDYDADGVCATSLLYHALKEYGIIADLFVPEREEGYGLNIDKILGINESDGVDLVITVDCGISEYKNVEILKQHGIDVIVSDHHEAPEILPNCLIVNPKCPNEKYPFNGLCGTGVAYKIANALIGEKANKYLDLVAVATVADSMELLDENRDLIKEGLKLLKPNKIRSCFKYLIGEGDKEISANTLAYQIAPRINAGGRMGDALTALKLLTTESEKEIFDISVKLNAYNIQRQEESQRVYEMAKNIIRQKRISANPIICVKGDGWNNGVIGIVATKLVEDYNRPVIVFAEHEGNLKGSARSIDDVNIFTLISCCQEKLLAFGGHSQAAGVSVSKENYEEFYSMIISKMKEIYRDVKFEKKIYCEWVIDEPISLDFAREITLLEPFGMGNKKPLFSTTCNQIVSRPLKDKSPHYTFETPSITMLDFNGEGNVETLGLDVDKSIVFEINYSIFHGRESAKGFVKKVIPNYAKYNNLELEIFANELTKLKAQNSKVNYIDFDKNLIKKGFGTIYTASNFEVLKNYQNADKLNPSLFVPSHYTGENQIVVSLRNIPEECERVIYLDNPLGFIENQGVESFCVNNLEVYHEIKTDRSNFAKIYTLLSNCIGSTFVNSVEFYKNNSFDVDAKTFIFATEVFFELGFFSIHNGFLIRNSSQKNELTNSRIYSKILKINSRKVRDV